MAAIFSTSFDDTTPTALQNVNYGTDWPVVYIIDNRTEAYVGETLDASVRVSQHLQNPERRRLTKISLISDTDFNKSVILDLEAYLIKRMSVDGLFTLQNGNMGLHLHNYYNRAYYENQFQIVWDQLREKHLAVRPLNEIENSDLFKYSPFNSLSTDQYVTVASIIQNLALAVKSDERSTSLVSGGPGTGKTVLAVHLMKLLQERNNGMQIIDPEEDELISAISENLKKLPKEMKVGFVVPMQSLRSTLKKVFEMTPGLSKSMVFSPMEIPKQGQFDLLVVDEAHRLRRRKGLSQYPSFDSANQSLGLGNDGTELDWILKKSKYQILFYDQYQSVKPADICKERFAELARSTTTNLYSLHTQFRCKGGDEYIQYIRSVVSDHAKQLPISFKEYDVRIFSDCGKMTDEIHLLNEKYDLCRTVAGYSWKWVSQSDPNSFDIQLDGRRYKWNTVDKDWINSDSSIDEIGCIHTVQGYDLNYCAVIFGEEIDYDFDTESFVIYKQKYCDNLGRAVGKDKDLLKEYILNIYRTLLTRGIRGTFIYACNYNLQRYLKRYFPES